MTLAQAFAKFERDLTVEGKKRRAIECYMGRVRNFLRFFVKLPEIQLDRTAADDIRNFRVWVPSPTAPAQQSSARRLDHDDALPRIVPTRQQVLAEKGAKRKRKDSAWSATLVLSAH